MSICTFADELNNLESKEDADEQSNELVQEESESPSENNDSEDG